MSDISPVPRKSGGVRKVAVGMAALAVTAGLTPMSVWAQDRATTSAHAQADRQDLLVNLTPTGTISVSSSQTGHSGVNAADGDAATTWMPVGEKGQLVADLHRVRHLGGVGITVGQSSVPATVSFQVADIPGHWETVPTLQNKPLTPGQPVAWSLPARYTNIRFVRVLIQGSGDQAPAIGELRLYGKDPATRSMALGDDLSFELAEEQTGHSFTDLDGQVLSADQIVRRHGTNYVRLRLWVNPPGGYDDLASDLEMAKRIKRDGMKILLDIHYSDFWADPGTQAIPAAWQGEDLSQLEETVENYTTSVVAAFARQGTPVDMVAIGNEVTNGMLWPYGKVNGDQGWDNFTALLKAGIRGVYEGSPLGFRPRIMLHVDQGGNSLVCQQFFDHMVQEGVPFDVIGLSYYPFWHGSLSDLRNNLDNLAQRYHKDIIVTETQYPWTLQNGDDTDNFVWSTSQLSPGYPASPVGQLSFVNDLVSILARVPDHHGAGVFYWEPEWLPGVGWEPGSGTPNDNMTLFDFQGHALPSINIFANPIIAMRDASMKQ
ncbi:glycosyl hydrolase 53 family protein [Alicyclobacillus herbarius]|uniref:glycosyl hydrolase 53 family protein n=1 Tax=Alicyclobacillus herbarius TaxID=122960 RepID=UPI00040869E3|nr:glycosyl hydrolase 53 family protein [Alicyclobacillus herbarius]